MITVYNNDIKEGGLLPLSCVINEELNGSYELTMVHPYDSIGKWQRLAVDKIIYADTPKGKQPFRIYNIEPDIESIKVNARHIFYDLLDNFVRSLNSTGTAQAALNALKNNLAYNTPFTFSTDIAVSGTVKNGNVNPVEILLGTGDEESSTFIEVFGGELNRNGYNVEMLLAMGEDRGYVISYGKNLTGLTVTEDVSTVGTRYMLYGADDVYYGSVDSARINDYSHPKIAVYSNPDATSLSQLQAEARALFEAGADLPTVNIKADFVLLQNTEEYKDYAMLESVYLGDVVTVRNRKMGFEKKAKVISYEYDALLKRYNKIELGDFLPNIYNSVTRGTKAQVTANAASTAVTQLATAVTQMQEQISELDARVEALERAQETT